MEHICCLPNNINELVIHHRSIARVAILAGLSSMDHRYQVDFPGALLPLDLPTVPNHQIH